MEKVLLNQFHDILPGTSIPEVFVTANQAWHEVLETVDQTITKALDHLSCHINYPNDVTKDAKPLLIFNPLNWEQTQLVEIPLEVDQKYQVIAWEKNSSPYPAYNGRKFNFFVNQPL